MRYRRHPAPSSAPRSVGRWLLITACLLLSHSLHAASPRISIILDDMGDHWQSGQRALQLPGAITYAFMPQTAHAETMARQAHAQQKEVMIHMPMEAMTGNPLGPSGLTLDMNREQFMQVLRDNLAAVPHAQGINNHMGSLLTRHPGHMRWLMEGLQQYAADYYFIDSRTTHLTVANQLALENNIPSLQRDVFLDDDPSLRAINYQLRRLLTKAKQTGQAIAIGHPYDTTLQALEQWLPTLAQHGIELVPVSQLFRPAPSPPVIRQADTESDNTLVLASPPSGEETQATTPTKSALNPL